MNKESTHLISLYEKAIANLVKKYEELLKKGHDINYQKALLSNLKKSYEEIRKQKGIVQKSLYDEYLERKIKEFDRAISHGIEIKFDYTKFTTIDYKNIEKLYKDFDKKIKRAEDNLGKHLNDIFTEKENKAVKEVNRAVNDEIILRHLGTTKQEAINTLTERLKDGLYIDLKNKHGKPIKMSIPAYAKLSVNTMFQQSKNIASIEVAKETETKLVKFSTHHWTCEKCARFAEGRVYSIDKRVKKYPYLYEIVPGFNEGYNSIHPNCKHLLSPYYETGENSEDLSKTRDLSNNNEDTRAEEDIKKYNLKQEINKLQRTKNNLNAKISNLRGVNLSEEGKEQLKNYNIRKKLITKKINSLRDNFKGL